jgi:hypothetical protein
MHGLLHKTSHQAALLYYYCHLFPDMLKQGLAQLDHFCKDISVLIESGIDSDFFVLLGLT